MKRILFSVVSVLALAATLCFAACSCEGGVRTTGRAYGLVHGHYVGQVTVERSGDKIMSVEIEETEGPSSWAKRANIKEDKAADVEFTTGGFAKSVSVGNIIFHATDDENTKSPAYKQNGDGKTFAEWVGTEANAKYYVEQMALGNYRLLKADGAAAEDDFSTEVNSLKKGERWLKSKNGYWQAGGASLGWQGNVDRISDYLVRNGIGSYKGDEQRGDTWVIDGVDTGATLVDFHDYMALAVKAYSQTA